MHKLVYAAVRCIYKKVKMVRQDDPRDDRDTGFPYRSAHRPTQEVDVLHEYWFTIGGYGCYKASLTRLIVAEEFGHNVKVRGDSDRGCQYNFENGGFKDEPALRQMAGFCFGG